MGWGEAKVAYEGWPLETTEWPCYYMKWQNFEHLLGIGLGLMCIF